MFLTYQKEKEIDLQYLNLGLSATHIKKKKIETVLTTNSRLYKNENKL